MEREGLDARVRVNFVPLSTVSYPMRPTGFLLLFVPAVVFAALPARHRAVRPPSSTICPGTNPYVCSVDGKPLIGVDASAFGIAGITVIDDPNDQVRAVTNMAGSHVGMMRTGLHWASVERTQGAFDWAQSDALFNAIKNAGAEPLSLAWLTPNWASSRPGGAALRLEGDERHPQLGNLERAESAQFLSRYTE
jgi:hypothetical protein